VAFVSVARLENRLTIAPEDCPQARRRNQTGRPAQGPEEAPYFLVVAGFAAGLAAGFAAGVAFLSSFMPFSW
jgi:hypothetical protein